MPYVSICLLQHDITDVIVVEGGDLSSVRALHGSEEGQDALFMDTGLTCLPPRHEKKQIYRRAGAPTCTH